MTIRKTYYGSVGPFLHDDEASVKDPDGDFSDENESALTTDGVINAELANVTELTAEKIFTEDINSSNSTTYELTVYSGNKDTEAGWLYEEYVDGIPTLRLQSATHFNLLLSASTDSYIKLDEYEVFIPIKVDINDDLKAYTIEAENNLYCTDLEVSADASCETLYADEVRCQYTLNCDDLSASSNIKGNYVQADGNIRTMGGRVYTSNTNNTYASGNSRYNIYVDADHSAKFYPDSAGGGVQSNGDFYSNALSFDTESLDVENALSQIMEAYRNHDLSKLPDQVRGTDPDTEKALVNQGNLLQASFVIIEKMDKEIKKLKEKL